MIPLLPYTQIVFESPLSKEEAVRRLTAEVASRSSGWFERRTEKFEGTVSAEDFQIRRIIRYRNSFLPVITGRFCPLVKGLRIEVSMRLHLAVLIFSIVWLSIVGAGAVAFGLQFFRTGNVEVRMLTPFVMLLFFYLLVMIGFGIEANKAKQQLGGIFEAEGCNRRESPTKEIAKA
jgi:hypothetical protein